MEKLLRSARSTGNYAAAATQALLRFTYYVRDGIPEGQYRYDVVTGKQLTARHKVLTLGELALSAGIALGVGLIVFLSVNASYSLKHSTYRYNYQENSEVEITSAKDEFLRTSHSRMPKAQAHSGGGGGGGHHGGSGVHFSSGGHSHGGGGGHF